MICEITFSTSRTNAYGARTKAAYRSDHPRSSDPSEAHRKALHVVAASVLFRAKYKAIMDRLGLLAEIPVEVWEKGWNVNCKKGGDGRLALRYLAPYVFRVAISNNRIVKVEPGVDGTGVVTFTYRPSGT